MPGAIRPNGDNAKIAYNVGSDTFTLSFGVNQSGLVFGTLSDISVNGKGEINIPPDALDYEIHWPFFNEPGRNLSTVVGGFFMGNGTSFDIQFRQGVKLSPTLLNRFESLRHAP